MIYLKELLKWKESHKLPQGYSAAKGERGLQLRSYVTSNPYYFYHILATKNIPGSRIPRQYIAPVWWETQCFVCKKEANADLCDIYSKSKNPLDVCFLEQPVCHTATELNMSYWHIHLLNYAHKVWRVYRHKHLPERKKKHTIKWLWT